MKIIDKIRRAWHRRHTSLAYDPIYVCYERLGVDGYRHIGTLYGYMSYLDAEGAKPVYDQICRAISEMLREEFHPNIAEIYFGPEPAKYIRYSVCDACDVINEGRHRIIIDAYTDPVTCRTTVYGAHIDRR